MTHAEFEITAGLVRDLLRDQHPDLADRPLTLGARGWDNRPTPDAAILRRARGWAVLRALDGILP